jgi:hypothetical protein
MEEEKKVFISYLDETGKRIDGYVTLIGVPGTRVRFKTSTNILDLPSERVLKIKEKEEDNASQS